MCRKCCDIRDSIIKVSESFMFRGCTDQTANMDRTSMDIGDGVRMELVDKFCYLVDKLSVDGDADAPVEARVRKGWNKFR